MFQGLTRRTALGGLAAVSLTRVAMADELTKATIALLRLSSSGPIFIAQEKGWFKEAGLDLTMKDFQAAAQVPLAVVSGDADLGVTAFTAGFFNLAAKGGLINLTRAMCVAYATDNIRTNCIAPGFIATPMVASVLNLFDDPDMADRLTPMRRPGTPEEMAYGCLYLASSEASYCNGTVLVIDGGTTARQ